MSNNKTESQFNAILFQDDDYLKQIIREVLNEKLTEHQDSDNSKTQEYLTRSEAAEILRLSLPTLDDYTQKGILKGYRVGKRILYLKSELHQSLKKITEQKYKRY